MLQFYLNHDRLVQIGRQFVAMLSSECQRCVVSALVDVAVESNEMQSASAAVSCLKQVLILARASSEYVMNCKLTSI